MVEYDPGSGKRRQNVHTKRWTDPGERDKIEKRKQYNRNNLEIFRPKDHHSTISRYVDIDQEGIVAASQAGKRHGGVYADAEKKTVQQLKKSVISRIEQVEHHAEKINSPEKYVSDWSERDPRERAGLLRKWEKDLRRNAEQAEIELAVYEKRFGK